jgi:hypothetical protein
MPNTLTNLIPDAYAALDVVSRELAGFIPAVMRDPTADRVAIGQTLRVAQAPANAAGGNNTPAMSLPSAADQTIGNKDLTISKSRFFPFSWSGEEQNAVDKGSGYLTIQQDQIAQAIRAAINEMETDLATAIYRAASRAYGTAGTTPFAGDLSDPANVLKILLDNGTPKTDLQLVIDTAAGAKLRTMGQLTKVNEAGTESFARQGVLLPLHGFDIRESAQIQVHTKGTGTSWVVNGSHAIGATTIAAKSGSGTILAGDVIVLQGDTNKYIVTAALAEGSLAIGAPGLKVAHTDGQTITVGNNYTANTGFRRQAVLLATRLPVTPKEGDLATDTQIITDPLTGISFELAWYPGFMMGVYHLRVVWGVKVIKPEHVANLLG